jgi:hypothetical protein
MIFPRNQTRPQGGNSFITRFKPLWSSSMRSLFVALTTLVALAVANSPAQAGFVYAFDPGASYTSSGGSINVNVYLVETDSNGTLASQGLFSAGVSLSPNNSAVAQVTSATNITPNSGFANNRSTVSSSAAVLQADNAGNNSIVYPNASTPNEILLGTFTFTPLATGTFTITANNISSFASNNVTGTFQDLTPLITGGQTAAITVTAVPEPGSMILGGLFATGLLGGYIRRRRLAVSA